MGSKDKRILVSNPAGLPTLPFSEFEDFQGDLKSPISEENLLTLSESIITHGVFVPKFVWFDEDVPKIIDGHQTKAALQRLSDEGWLVPEIPYVEVEAGSVKDAVAKVLQLNSRYAETNSNTSFFDEAGFSPSELEDLLEAVRIPDLDVDALLEPITLPTPDKPYFAPNTVVEDYSRITRAEDADLLPSPLERFPENPVAEEDDQTFKRIILIYHGSEQKSFLENLLGVDLGGVRITFSVDDLLKGKGENGDD